MDGRDERHELLTQPIINITSYFATSEHPDSTVDYFEGLRFMTLPFLCP